MGGRVIEKLREREPLMNKPHPVEIAEDETLPRFLLHRPVLGRVRAHVL